MELTYTTLLSKKYKYNSSVSLTEVRSGKYKMYLVECTDGLTHELKSKMYQYEKSARNFADKRIRFFERFYK